MSRRPYGFFFEDGRVYCAYFSGERFQRDDVVAHIFDHSEIFNNWLRWSQLKDKWRIEPFPHKEAQAYALLMNQQFVLSSTTEVRQLPNWR